MYVKKFTSSQITIDFPALVGTGTSAERMPWVVLIGKNGSGKTTLLKTLASNVGRRIGRLDASQLDPNVELTLSPSEGLFAAYGAHRALPDLDDPPNVGGPNSSLFIEGRPLCGLSFLSHLEDAPARRFRKIINRVLSNGLLPDLQDVVINNWDDVLSTARLSYGFRSALAWIADMVGHAVTLDESIEEPAQVRGLVLVDGIDLHLYPTLHVGFIQGLMKTFPMVQFVVTTNSPLMLGAFRTDQDKIIRLERGDDPVEKFGGRDPDVRLMTVAEVYQRYFGLDRVFAGIEGLWAAEWQSTAHNPYRGDAEEEHLDQLYSKLESAGVRVRPREPRRT